MCQKKRRLGRRSLREIAAELRLRLKRAMPYHCTFIDAIPQENKAAAESALKAAFQVWAGSWIEPLIDSPDSHVEDQRPSRSGL